MNCVKRLTLILVAASALLTQAVAQMPHNAFLNKPAHSVTQLIQQFKSDPVVRKRFVKHYGVSEGAIVDFFKTLRVAKLSKTGYFKVYNVDRSYVIRAKMLRVRAGTLVFVDPAGRPALIKSCGNPTDITVVEITPPTPRLLIENPVLPLEPLVPMPEEEFLPETPEEMYPPEAIVPPVVPVPYEVPVVVEKRRRSFFPIPIPIPIVRHKDCPPEVIPGPAAAITFGMMALARRRRRTK